MKRTIRVKLEYRITLDDAGEGLPFDTSKIHDIIVDGIRALVPESTFVEPGAKIDVGLTRESFVALRAKYRESKARKAAAR